MLSKITNFKKHIFYSLVGVLLSTPAFASLGSPKNKLKDIIEAICNFITGEIGASICALAIIGTGFLWLKMGRIEKEQAVGTMLGIGLIYSASYIVQTVMGIS